MKSSFRVITLAVLCVGAFGQSAPKALNPTVRKVVEGVSAERITAILKKLESFETRNIFSDQESSTRGVGAAYRWIYDEFRSYSPRLEVSYEIYKVKKQGRLFLDVEIR